MNIEQAIKLFDEKYEATINKIDKDVLWFIYEKTIFVGYDEIKEEFNLDEDNLNGIIAKLTTKGLIDIEFPESDKEIITTIKEVEKYQKENQDIYAQFFSMPYSMYLSAYLGFVNSITFNNIFISKFGRNYVATIILPDLINETSELARKAVKDVKKVNSKTKKLVKIKNEIKKMEKDISNFYKNIIVIISIVFTAFSILIININQINISDSNFLLNILVVNMSIVFSIVTFFLILNNIIFNRKSKLLLWMFISLLIVFIGTITIFVLSRIGVVSFI